MAEDQAIELETNKEEHVEIKVEQPKDDIGKESLTEDDEKEKLKVGFQEPETEKKIGAIDTVVGGKSNSKKKSPNQRTTTLAKMRKTLADGAKETADVISDASSFSLANKVEAILWAIQESKEDDWQVPDDLTLSEAFMLFWRKSDGSVEGRKTSASLQALAYGAMLADLIHKDKIVAQKMNKKVGFVNYTKYVVRPTSDLELDSFLDEALLDIIEQHGAGKKKTLAKYVEDVATSFSEGALMTEVILESLVERNICSETKSTWLGSVTKKWPLGENKKVFEDLHSKLRSILLDDNVEATPFETFLLRLLRQADKEYLLRNPFMGNILKSKVEWNKAKSKGLAKFDKLAGEE